MPQRKKTNSSSKIIKNQDMKRISVRKAFTLLTLSLFCCFISGQIVWDGETIADGFAQGNGTEDDPFLISTPAEFVYFLKSINTINTYAGQYVKLANEISFDEKSINIDGSYYQGFGSFDGYFDGDNHFINSLSNFNYLFDTLNGTICNLGIENDNKDCYGSITRQVSSTGLIVSCTKILKYENYGSYRSYPVRYGFAEQNNGEIINCKLSGTINTTYDYGYNYMSAGIAVYNYGTILHCDLSDFSFCSNSSNYSKKAVSNNHGVIDYGDLGPGYDTSTLPATNSDDAFNEWVSNHNSINYNLPIQNSDKLVYVKDTYGIIPEEVLTIPNGSLLSSYKQNPDVADCIFAGWETRGKFYSSSSPLTVDDNMIIYAKWTQEITSQPTSENLSVTVSDSEHALYQWYACDGEINIYPDWTSPSISHDRTTSYQYDIPGGVGQQLSFDWETSSESCDELIVKVDGEIILRQGGVGYSGHVDYTFTNNDDHVVIVSYSRDDSDTNGENKVWVKNIFVSESYYALSEHSKSSLLLQDMPTDGYVWCEITYSNSDTELTTNKINASRTPNYIYSNSMTLKAGEVYNMPVYLNNEVDIANLQFDLDVPNGILIESVNGEYNLRKGERCSDDHSVSCRLISGSKYRILCTSTSNAAISDIDKELPVLYIPLVVDENISLGKYALRLKDIIVNSYDISSNTTQSYTTNEWIVDAKVTNFWRVNVSTLVDEHGEIFVSGEEIRNDNLGVMAASNSQVTLNATPSSYYSFSHWEENGSILSTDNPLTTTVNSDRAINAVFVYDAYSMNYVVDGEIYYSVIQKYNDKLIVPDQDPYKEGYSFIGWQGVSSQTLVPQNDATFIAQFSINSYNVRFVANDQILQNNNSNYGLAITPPDPPVVDNYVFISWGALDTTVPAHDVVYTAEYVLLGDLYEDGRLNVVDLTNLVGLILSLPEEISERALKIADLYKDETINVSDYTSLVGKILNYPVTQYVQRRGQKDQTNLDVSVVVNTNNTQTDVTFRLNNNLDISALQFDVSIPSDLALKTEDIITLNGYLNHSVSYSYIGDDKIRIVIYSSMNDVISSEDDLSLHFDVKNNSGNEFSIGVENIIGASYNSQLQFDAISVPVLLGNTTSSRIIKTDKGLAISYEDGCIILKSDVDQDVVLMSLDKEIIETIHIEKNGVVTKILPRGYYLINGSIYYLF